MFCGDIIESIVLPLLFYVHEGEMRREGVVQSDGESRQSFRIGKEFIDAHRSNS
jgi:hypothetical protein